MNRNLVVADYLVFIVYFVVVASYGIWIYRRKKKTITDTKDFFLAEGTLTWWAIGASLIASNISAEQFIGMSGDGTLLVGNLGPGTMTVSNAGLLVALPPALVTMTV